MKRDFKLRFNPQIYIDIQKTVDYYLQETGNDELGRRFVKTIKTELKWLSKSALHYQIRYDNIRFLPISSFSFIAHYRVDEESNMVSVEAIIHTSESPDSWKERIWKHSKFLIF